MAHRQDKRRVTRPSRVSVLIFAALLLVFVPLIWRSMFAIRSIDVQGHSFCTREEVIRASGLNVGDSIFSLKNDEIEANINGHRYLEFVSVWRNYFPCSIVLTVEEHMPGAKLQWLGLQILIGDHGLVLEQTPQIDMPIPVPEIVGMTVSHARVGQELVYGVTGQGDAINAILDALHSAGLARDIKEIHVSMPDSLYMTMENGLQIMLGNSENMQKKVALLSDVLPYIDQLGNVKGYVLDISTGKTADFGDPSASPSPEPTQPSTSPTTPPEEGTTP